MGRRLEPDVTAIRGIKRALMPLTDDQALRALDYMYAQILGGVAEKPEDMAVVAARYRMALEAVRIAHFGDEKNAIARTALQEVDA